MTTLVHLIAIVFLWLSPCTGTVQGTPQPTEAEKRLITAAHAYHGVLVSTRYPDGRWTFERDGRTCRVLTDGCKARLRKRGIQW